MLVLLLLPLVHHVLAKGTAFPKQNNFIMKHTESCPDVGYFFKREMSNHIPSKSGAGILPQLKPGPCYLCFCRENGTAVCWPRENKRCDAAHYHHGKRKRDTRERRSPGFTDIFFRDATRDVFNRQTPEQCKPYESSFSEGCPPVDWCIGCTVCDCDANGRWDCHILSFCDTGDGKKKMKKKHRSQRRVQAHRRNHATTNAIKNTKEMMEYQGTQTTKSLQITEPAKKTVNKKVRKVSKNNRTSTKKVPAVKNTTTKSLKKRSFQEKKVSLPNRASQINKSFVINKGKINQPTVKQNQPAKKQPPKNQISLKKASPTKKRLPLNKQAPKMIKTSVTQKKKAAPKNKPTTTDSSATTNAPLTYLTKESLDKMTAQIGHDVVTKFMKAIQERVLQKQIELGASRNIKKRSTINKEVIKNVTGDYVGDSRKPIKLLENNKQKVQKDDNSSKNKRTTMNAIKRYRRELVIQDKTQPNVNLSSPQDVNNSFHDATTEIQNTTFTIKKYYKYSLDNIIENITSEDLHDYDKIIKTARKNATAKLYLEDQGQEKIFHADLNSIDIEKPSENSTVTLEEINTKATLNKQKSALINRFPDINDLQFNKWAQVKALIDKKRTFRAKNVNTTTPVAVSQTDLNFNITTSNVYTTTPMDTSIRGNEVTGIKTTDKCESKNNDTTLNDNYRKYTELNIVDHPKMNKNISNYSLQKLFKKIVNRFGAKNVTKKSRAKRLKVIKYLQKFFKNIFYRSKNAVDIAKKYHVKLILESICDNFGPCDISTEIEEKIKTKIDVLKVETNKILRTIKTIKGLLKLIDSAENDIDLKNVKISRKSKFKNEIKKLHAILTDIYIDEENKYKVTKTQKNLIECIKSNTKLFALSASKFANTLNEIIDLIQKPNTDNTHIQIEELPQIVKYALNKRECEHSKDVKYNRKEKEPIEKLKNLLMKYNLLQNRFMRGLYKIVNNFETGPVKERKKYLNVNEPIKKRANTTGSIQIYTRNIFKNLRQLKSLAQKLNSGSRTKRELREEDSMEYLLMLMEYLIKQNHPLDAAPVNDGIDLLIEAIKYAPNIKPIKKKVLQSKPVKRINVTKKFSTTTERLNISNEDSTVDLNEFSNEDNLTKSSENAKPIISSPPIDNIVDDEDKNLDNRTVQILTTTELINNRRSNKEKKKKIYYVVEVTEPPVNMETETSPDVFTAGEDKQDLTKGFLFASSGEKGEEGGRFEVFNAELDDEFTITDSTKTSLVTPDLTTELAPLLTPYKKKTTETDYKELKTKHSTNDITDSDSESVDKKNDFDWLDQSFEEETANETKTTVKPAMVSPKTPDTTINTLEDKKVVENMSSMMKEFDGKDHYNWYNTNEIMHKKEMNLLNSLDYHTEKYEVEVSDSKDASIDIDITS